MDKIRSFIAHTLFILPTIVYADDATFGGSGAAPIPMQQNDVAMVSENVVITGHDIDRANFQGEWQYDCHYRFKNNAAKRLSFRMGFPFPVNDESGNTTAPAGYHLSQGGALVHDFTLHVRGQLTPAQKFKITPLPDKHLHYTDAYLWDITLQPNEVVNITHRYITGITFNVIGQHDVAFVLKTGALWHGSTIHDARLAVIPNTPSRLCLELEPKATYAVPKPPGMRIVGEGQQRKYLWQLSNFQPKDDLQLCLITAKNYVRYFIVNPLVYQTADRAVDIQKMNTHKLRLLKNTIYAQYGRAFSDPYLQAYFTSQWWYLVNPQYTDALLTEDDRKALALIEHQQSKITAGLPY